MAGFKKKASSPSDTTKAVGFINVSVEMESGSKQIGGIPLTLNKELHAALIEHLKSNKLDTLDLSISYHEVQSADSFVFKTK